MVYPALRADRGQSESSSSRSSWVWGGWGVGYVYLYEYTLEGYSVRRSSSIIVVWIFKCFLNDLVRGSHLVTPTCRSVMLCFFSLCALLVCLAYTAQDKQKKTLWALGKLTRERERTRTRKSRIHIKIVSLCPKI